MTSLLWGLAGAFVFILAYAYYTVAGMFNLPGGDAGTALIEFGMGIAMLILSALLMAACLAPSRAAPVRERQPGAPAPRDPSA